MQEKEFPVSAAGNEHTLWIINMVTEVTGAFVGLDYVLCMYKVNGVKLMCFKWLRRNVMAHFQS